VAQARFESLHQFSALHLAEKGCVFSSHGTKID
jgi:hypothetical protein